MNGRTVLRGLALGAVLVALMLSPARAGDVEGAPSGAQTDLSGIYAVKGQDPEGTSKYEGKVAVVKHGNTYRVDWALEDHHAVGTGIATAKTFAVTFVTPGLPVPGLAVFEIAPSGTLTGTFTLLGARDIGLETWTPQTY